MTKRVLTGINTTGTLHIGNYVGAIRPAIRDSRNPDVQSFFFLADLHALIKCQDPARIERSRRQIAATWLAAGLDPDKVVFYRQSDIPEIPTLNWLLTCCTAKGQMNRAHAYKAATDAAVEAGRDPDSDVSMGLYCYPILMAADILMFNADRVPVGGSAVEVLPGLDGRKMSKSYNNVIPLFEGGRKALDEAVSRIVTDSKLPGEPKDPDSNSLCVLYAAFSTPEELEAFKAELRAGLGWGEAKKRLADKIDAEIGPMRKRYEELMASPETVEAILQEGARKARAYAVPFLARLKEAVGLRAFTAPVENAAEEKTAKQAKALFKQYREKDGLFYFKLTMNGRELLLSEGFASGRDAGQWVGRLKKEGYAALEGAPVARTEGTTDDDLRAALDTFRED